MVDSYTRCLEPEVLAAYVDRGLSLAERARVDHHLASCPHCIAMVAGVVRTVEAVSEFLPIGDLRRGVWDVRSARRDSRSTWHLDGSTLSLRLPWSMLALGDPSSHTAVVPAAGQPKAVTVDGIGVLVDAGAAGEATTTFRWDNWQRADYTERLKPGVQPLVNVWAALSRPAR